MPQNTLSRLPALRNSFYFSGMVVVKYQADPSAGPSAGTTGASAGTGTGASGSGASAGAADAGTNSLPWFSLGGDSGALVTGDGDDTYAYGVVMSGEPGHRDPNTGELYNASFICRLDTTMQLMADNFNLNLDFAHRQATRFQQTVVG